MANVIRSKRSAVPGKVPLEADLELGELAVNTNDGKLYMKKNDGVESIVDLTPSAMMWKDEYQALEYQKNDTVRDGDYTMVANKTTTDKAAPQTHGAPDYLLPDAPTWSDLTNSTIVYTGVEITGPAGRFFRPTAYRFWAPSTSTAYHYTIWGVNNDTNIWTKIGEFSGDKVDLGWNVINFNGSIFSEGQSFSGVLETSNSSANTTILGGWTRGASGNSDPAAASWNTSNNNSTLRIDRTDLDSDDRTLELLSIVSDSVIVFVDAGDNAKSVTYDVVGPGANHGTYINYAVSIADVGSGGEPSASAVTQMTATVPVLGTTDYVSLTDGLINSVASQGTISLTGDYSDHTLSEDGYGFDIEFQEYTVSDDWDILAISSGGAAVGNSNGTGLVDSVFGRVDAVVAEAGDYSDITETLTNKTIDLANNTLTGVDFSNLAADLYDVNSYFNCASLESQTVVVSSNGTIVSLAIEKAGGGDCRYKFSDGVFHLDTTPAVTVPLIVGTDTVPAYNFVYIPQDTKLLTASAVGWPAVEHAPIAIVMCQSALSVQNDGVYKCHAWTDHVAGTDEQGHLSHLNYWVRNQAATWTGGVGLSTVAGSAQLDVSVTSGQVLQLHPHPFPVFDTAVSSHMYIINDPTTAYLRATDLTQTFVSQDINGTILGGASSDFYNLVVWGVISEEANDCQLMVNLPDGVYANNNADIAILDGDNTAIYRIPNEYLGTGFLIARLTIQETGGTYTVLQNEDLRGLTPQAGGGGGGGGGGTASPLTTKGDMFVFGIEDTRLAVGTDGTILAADSTQPTGLNWVAGVNSVDGRSGVVTLDDLYATSAQGILADSALQSGDNVSALTNDAGYITSAVAAPIDTVFGRTGDVVALDGDYGLDLLGDVDLTGLLPAQVLEYNGTAWRPIPTPAGGGGGAILSVFGRTGTVIALEGDYDFTDLGDVDTTGVVDTNILKYNGTTWVPAAAPVIPVVNVDSVFGRTGDIVALEGDYDFTDLGDVDTTSALPTNILSYDGIKWGPTPAVSVFVDSVFGRSGDIVALEGDYDLGQMGDVDVAGALTTNVLTFNGTTWYPAVAPSVPPPAPIDTVFGRTGDIVALEGDYDLGQMGDVNTTGASFGQYLTHNGSGWVATPAPAAAPVTTVFGRDGVVVAIEGDYDLGQMGDVSLSGLAVGDLLSFTGTAWVPVNNTAVQPGDNVSTLTNNVGYLTVITGESINDLSDVDTSAAGNGKILSHDGSGWVAQDPAPAVTTVFGRSGVVVAEAGDYSAHYLPKTNMGGYSERAYAGPPNSIDCSAYNVYHGGLGTSTVGFTNIPVGMFTFTFIVTDSGATFPAGTLWQGGLSPILTADTDIVILTTPDQGTTWLGSYTLGYA